MAICERALDIFHGSDVSVTRDGRSVLGCPIGTDSSFTALQKQFGYFNQSVGYGILNISLLVK